MNIWHYTSTFLLALLLFPATLTGAASATPKAIFIIVDGIPTDVLSSVNTPAMDEISAVGGYTPSSVGGSKGGPSESPTISAVGYMSLITGTWANKHNVWDNDIEEPNYRYWDIFRIAHEHDPTLHTALFSTWEDNRTKLVGNGLPEAGGDKLDYYFDGFENNEEQFPHDWGRTYIENIDDLVTQEAARYIEAEGPDLSWVYLEYTDTVAHQWGDGAKMAAAVEAADQRVGQIWSAIKTRQQVHNEDWLIVITTDHGRDAKTGRSHGGQSERERATWIVTNSLNLNEKFEQDPTVVDILPSLVRHLELQMPAAVAAQLDGQSFLK